MEASCEGRRTRTAAAGRRRVVELRVRGEGCERSEMPDEIERERTREYGRGTEIESGRGFTSALRSSLCINGRRLQSTREK